MDRRIKLFTRHLDPSERRCRAPRSEPREESGLQFAASGRFLSPVPVRDEASGLPTVPTALPPRERRLLGRSAEPPSRIPTPLSLRPGRPSPELRQPADSRDPIARSSAFQRSAPRCGLRLRVRLHRPPRLAARTGLAFHLGLSALFRNPKAPCFAGRSRRFALAS